MYINNIKVDEYQERAILCDKNCLLIAGAGAGKTFTILGKIDYILKNKIYKENEILIISFTNKSVNDIKKKLNYNIDVFTFHKLAINILKDHNIPFKIADDALLTFTINEFFYSLNDDVLKTEILHYFHENNYQNFLTSTKFQNLKKIISTFIKLFKTNNCTTSDIKSTFYTNRFYTKLILIIMKIYETELVSSGQKDFDDIIKEATTVLKTFYKYKYIIIDEFQDTSILRWNLIDKLLKLNNAKIFAVGDDFQSIYHFSGCDLNLFLNFSTLVSDAVILKLKNTYRNSQELINIAGKFVLKNNKQIKKELLSSKSLKKPIIYKRYLNKKRILSKTLDKVLLHYEDILILQRNNKDIYAYLSSNMTIDKDFITYKNKKIRYMTVHSSKGLEADAVILINLTDDTMGFPNKIANDAIIDSINRLDDNYLFAEERRLFYVALTRTKNEVFLLTPLFHKSKFVKEIRKITS